MDKPHRVILDRVAGYADEATAYLRRRRISRKPFARVHWAGGRSAELAPDDEAGRALFLAASRVLGATRASDDG
jgi:hypothetical protein